MRKLIFRITHDGRQWIINNERISLSSSSLEELDIKVKELLTSRGELKPGERLKVLMQFDNYSIPQWIRQYSQHYFDRIIELQG